MLGFAPDVFVTNYLKSTNQLSGEVADKALGFMEKGCHIVHLLAVNNRSQDGSNTFKSIKIKLLFIGNWELGNGIYVSISIYGSDTPARGHSLWHGQ